MTESMIEYLIVCDCVVNDEFIIMNYNFLAGGTQHDAVRYKMVIGGWLMLLYLYSPSMSELVEGNQSSTSSGNRPV